MYFQSKSEFTIFTEINIKMFPNLNDNMLYQIRS